MRFNNYYTKNIESKDRFLAVESFDKKKKK